MRPVYFNGKFYAGGLNGVHRVADRLIREYDAILAAMDPAARPVARLFVPKRRQWEPALKAIELVEEAGAESQRWEQFRLPRIAADGVLVNLCNLAPIAHRRKILMLHDAQFLFPDSSYPWRQKMGYRLLTPRMARSSAAVLTVSGYSRQMLDLLGVAPRGLTHVVYNGADHIHEQEPDASIFERLGIDPGGYVLMFGSPKAYKNVGIVFEALRSSNWPLVVVGPDQAALERVGLVAPDKTVFAGGVDDAALRALYQGAHCLAFPSRTEGFGLPPVEAMLCGCPVVAAPAGALPEVARDAVLYADVDDAHSWNEAFENLRDTAIREIKIAAGAVRARAFSWRAAGQQLYGVCKRVGDHQD